MYGSVRGAISDGRPYRDSDRRLTPGKRQTGHVCTSLDMYGNALVDPALKWSFLFKTGSR